MSLTARKERRPRPSFDPAADGGRERCLPGPFPASCVEALVGATERERFLADDWERRTFLGRQSVDDALTRALELDVLSFKRAARAVDRGSLRAYTRSEKSSPQEIAIDAHQLDELFWSGMTIAVFGIHKVHTPIFAFLRALREETGFEGPMVATAFLSPPGSGYGLHFDHVDVVNLQLQGTKTWRFAGEPALRHPLLSAKLADVPRLRDDHPWFRPAMPTRRTLRGAALAPGDVLYLPAGTWHEAAAEDVSLSLSITFESTSRSRTLADRLCVVLNRLEAWRAERAPDGARVAEGSEDGVLALAEKLAEVAPSDAREPEAEEAPAAVFAPTREERFTVAHPFRFSPDKSGRDEVEIVTAARTFSLGPEALPLLERLSTLDTFTAGELLRWPLPERVVRSWAEVRLLLSELVGLGLLRPTGGRSPAPSASTGRARRTRASRGRAGRVEPARPGKRKTTAR